MIERNVELIKLRVEYDNIDKIIIDSLRYSNLTVSQLQAIISHKLHDNISSMVIFHKLEFFIFLGKIKKTKKNARVFIYSLI